MLLFKLEIYVLTWGQNDVVLIVLVLAFLLVSETM